MTEDYRGHTRGTLSRDPPSANDKDSEGRLPRSPDSAQVHETLGQECVVGTQDKPGPREQQEHTVLEAFFQKLTEKAIMPHQTTRGSVGYDLFTPINFVIQPQE